MKFPHLLPFAGAVLLLTSTVQSAEDFYVGTYTKFFGSKGIYHFQFDEKAGTIFKGQLAVRASNPSFLAIHPNQRWLYAVNETENGTVSAYAIALDRQLQKIGEVSAKGSGPCHLSLDASHRYVFVANYGSGSVAVLPIRKDGGVREATGFDQHHGKGPNASRQEGPHAHSIYSDSANRFVYACDLGNDRVEGYRFNPERGTIQPAKAATAKLSGGSGPRHLVLSPRGYAYVINEMANTVTTLRRDTANGGWQTLQTIPTLPPGFPTPNTTAEIALHPNGKFLYASNRGQNSIATYAVHANGRLSHVENVATGGKTPRHFAIDPSGRWLLAANQDTNDIFVFALNPTTGRLTATGRRVLVGAPVCVTFMAAK